MVTRVCRLQESLWLPLGKGEGGYGTRARCTGGVRLAEGPVCPWTLCPADPLFLDVRAGVVQFLGQGLEWFHDHSGPQASGVQHVH